MDSLPLMWCPPSRHPVAGIAAMNAMNRGPPGNGLPAFAADDKAWVGCYHRGPIDNVTAHRQMADKSNKLKARLPRGLADRGPAEIAATRRMLETIRAVYERYGFEPMETPAIEYTDALGKFLPDQDRPNEGVFSFQDDDEQWLSLRYDLTAPLARYVAENFDALPKPYRSLSCRLGVPQREAGPRPLPPVHAVRRRYGRLGIARRRCRDLHDGGRHHGSAWAYRAAATS